MDAGQKLQGIFFCILLLTPYWKMKFWNLLVPSERSSSDLSEYTLFQIIAKLFRLVARSARVGILNWRPGGSREVLVSVSESGSNDSEMLIQVLIICGSQFLKPPRIMRHSSTMVPMSLYLPTDAFYWIEICIGNFYTQRSLVQDLSINIYI